MSRSPALINQYPECFVGLRKKSKVLELVSENLLQDSHLSV